MRGKPHAARFSPTDEANWLQRYLNGDLGHGDCAWFEGYLLTREPLIAALESANGQRDRAACTMQSGALTRVDIHVARPPLVAALRILSVQSTGTEIQVIADLQRPAAALELNAQELLTSARTTGLQYCGETCNHGRSSGCTVEKSTRSTRIFGVVFPPRTSEICPRSHAKDVGSSIAADGILSQHAVQIGRADGEHLTARRWLFDPVALRIAIARRNHDQNPFGLRQAAQRSRQDAQRRAAGTLEANTNRKDLGARRNRPCGTDLERETIAATAVVHDLGDHQSSVAGDSVAAMPIGRHARAGDDAGSCGAVTVSAAILGAAIADEGRARGNAPTHIGMGGIEPAIEHAHDHALTGGYGQVHAQGLRGKDPRAECTAGANLRLLRRAHGLGKVNSQALNVQTVQRVARLAAHKNGAQCRHKQRIGVATSEPVADHILAPLAASFEQPRDLAGRQSPALLELPSLGESGHSLRLRPDAEPQTKSIDSCKQIAVDSGAVQTPGETLATHSTKEFVMSKYNSLRSFNIAFVAALTMATALPASAGQKSCLTRGTGATEHFLSIESIADVNQWISQGALIVHNAKNMPECTSASAACNVANGDILTVSASDEGQLMVHRLRPGSTPIMRDYAKLLPSADGRFLRGISQGINGQPQQVFLYFTGSGHCSDTGMDYPAQSQCRFFQFEAFPVNFLQDDRPDANGANWTSGLCPSAAQQPGEGGMLEPPQPQP